MALVKMRAISADTFALIGLGGVLGYAVFQEATSPLDQWQYCPLAIGLISIVYWLFIKQSAPFKSSWMVLLLPGYALLQFFTISVKPPATFSHFLRIVAFTIVFVTVRHIAQKRAWEAAALPVIVVAALEAGLALLRYFFGPDASGGAQGTYPNRDHFAGLLEMALPLAIVSSLRWRLLWIPAGIILGGLVCSYSRGAFISTLCALSVIAIMMLGGKWTGPGRSIAAVSVLAGAFLLFLYLPPDAFFDRFTKASEEDVSTFGGRLTHAKHAPQLIREYATLGCGLGGFESAFIRLKDIYPRTSVKYIHNDYLQGLIELGIPGFAIVSVLIVSALNAAIQFRNLACVGALAAILLHSLTDFNLYVPANAMTFVWICGIAMSLRDSNKLNVVQPDCAA
jgi:O-antigen ligase